MLDDVWMMRWASEVLLRDQVRRMFGVSRKHWLQILDGYGIDASDDDAQAIFSFREGRAGQCRYRQGQRGRDCVCESDRVTPSTIDAVLVKVSAERVLGSAIDTALDMKPRFPVRRRSSARWDACCSSY